MKLRGKSAVITGSANGIGQETALLFVKEGASVCLSDINDSGGQIALEKCIKLVSENSRQKVIFVKTDVSSAHDVKQLFQKAYDSFGRLDIVINNAGVMLGSDDDAINTSEDTWNKTFDVNVKGVFFGCKYGIPELRKSGGGSIINVASFVARMGAATPQLAYTASKGAVLAMTRELAVIHARENIRVNALCPGPIRTKLLMDFLDTEEKKQRRLVHVPMGRFGEAIEMANAMLFLASDQSSFVTGTDFLVDGGLCASYVTPLGETKSICPVESLADSK